MSEQAEIGIIGGSGLYEMEGFTDVREVAVETPFGPPSDASWWALDGRRVAFLPRHGRGHRILPTELNFRANIFAMKALGVERILSVSAVGSLKEQYAPLHMVDARPVHRPHDSSGSRRSSATASWPTWPSPTRSAEPLEGDGRGLRGGGGDASTSGGTYVCMEGPQFSTLAESELYRSWGVDLIGMTNLQEAKLAREAEICYATLAMVTDYDCWHPDHDAVTAEQIIGDPREERGDGQGGPAGRGPAAPRARATASARPPSSTRS